MVSYMQWILQMYNAHVNVGGYVRVTGKPPVWNWYVWILFFGRFMSNISTCEAQQAAPLNRAYKAVCPAATH